MIVTIVFKTNYLPQLQGCVNFVLALQFSSPDKAVLVIGIVLERQLQSPRCHGEYTQSSV